MAIVPFRRGKSDISRLHRDMDELFNSFFGGLDMPWGTRRGEAAMWPALDVADRENDVLVKMEVPGCKPEDIDISVKGNILSITGEKKEEKEDEQQGYYHAERSYGTFRRDVTLPSNVDAGNVDAKYKDGILSVTLPKSEKAKAVKVKVKGE